MYFGEFTVKLDGKGRTLLHFARTGKIATIFLEKRLNPLAMDLDGRRPADLARKREHPASHTRSGVDRAHQATVVTGIGTRSRAEFHDKWHTHVLWNELIAAANHSKTSHSAWRPAPKKRAVISGSNR